MKKLLSALGQASVDDQLDSGREVAGIKKRVAQQHRTHAGVRGKNTVCLYEHRGKAVNLNAEVAQYVPTTPNQRSSNAYIRSPTRCHQVRMLASVRLVHMFIAILSHPDRRNHSSTAQLKPMSLSHGKPFIPELPTRLTELSYDVPHTIFAYPSDSGHTCVCRWSG